MITRDAVLAEVTLHQQQVYQAVVAMNTLGKEANSKAIAAHCARSYGAARIALLALIQRGWVVTHRSPGQTNYSVQYQAVSLDKIVARRNADEPILIWNDELGAVIKKYPARYAAGALLWGSHSGANRGGIGGVAETGRHVSSVKARAA